MNNLKIYIPLTNGSRQEFVFESGKELIHDLFTDDWGCPPTSMNIEAVSENGVKVTISIPYDNKSKAFVKIENQ